MIRFEQEYADAMRVGSPGACGMTVTEIGGATHTIDALPYHVLDGDAVRTLREAGAGGGLAYCERCGKGIFIPGDSDAGMIVRGFPTTIPLQGVSV